jgi:hypothetical protein
MSTKILQISSGQFVELSQNVFSDLQNDNDFLDVTLVCNGDKQIQAHKVVLASFSSFFKSLLRNNPHQHPLIYPKGLEMEDLQAIITFIYTGEVTVSEESLDNILEISRDLEIKGLFEDDTDSDKVKVSRKQEDKHPTKDNNTSCLENSDDYHLRNFSDETIKTEVIKSDLPTKYVGDEFNLETDTKIKKERIYSCNQCDYEATHSALLWRHKSTAHTNQSYACDQCSHTTNSKDSLLRHKRNRHGLDVTPSQASSTN